MAQHRKLAAIMFTDIVGYTAMMQKNEPAAVQLLAHHQAILEDKIPLHHGELVSYYGDGSLSIFGSITQAVQSALEIQQASLKDPKVPLRIGLHTGEVLVEEEKVVGDSVNLASRIQSLGIAGSILFSKEVFEKIKNHPQFTAVYLGNFMLKNVHEPMEIYALSHPDILVPTKEDLDGAVRAKKTVQSRKTLWKGIGIGLLSVFILLNILRIFLKPGRFIGKEKSIAVLPFKNMNGDTVQEYFSDGITEDITTHLSKIAGLRVISSASVMQYKNTPADIKKIGNDLDVATVLEGSVRREGNEVRITAQLINAKNNQQIWANSYDKSINDVFSIQSEVAMQIAGELNVKLSEAEGARIQHKATNNMAAYEDYLLARQSNFREAEKLLESALQKDSTFALAWASLALIYSKLPTTDSFDRQYYVKKSLNAALTAVNYGPELAEPHMILGDILKTITLNPNLSIKELNKSITINPNNAEGYLYLSFALMELGRFPEAEANLKKASQLDPKSFFIVPAWSLYYYYSRNVIGLEKLIRSQHISDTISTDLRMKLSYYFLKDQYDSMLLSGNGLRPMPQMGIALIKTGKTAQVNKIIDSLKKELADDNWFDIAILYAWMGEKQKAMDYLKIAYKLNDYGLISIRVNKIFDPLRKEDSFKKLLARMETE